MGGIVFGKYVGYVRGDDRLHGFLAGIVRDQLGVHEGAPAFRAFRLNGSNEVYAYEEKHSLAKVICKFYGPRYGWDRDRAAGIATQEFESLQRLRGFDLVGSPHHVIRPLGLDRDINCVLALEFYAGEPFSHAIARSIHQRNDEHLFWRLKALAYFLATQHNRTANGRTVVLLPKGEDLVPIAGAPSLPELDASDMTAARWAWEKGEPAGWGAGTLPQIGWTFFPLQGLSARAGVAGIEAGKLKRGSEEERLALALLGQGAVALERAELAAGAVEHETLRRSDHLRAALMNSISHDLRTPLSTVLGAATTLIDYGATLTEPVKADLLLSIREEAERLNRYVGNLLDMTKLEGGGLKTRKEWVDARDVIAAAVERVSRRVPTRVFHRDFPPELTMVEADSQLLEQALVNIIENAVAYSPEALPIEVAAYEDRGNVVISIEDEGRGIPTDELERVFDKFRRLDSSSDRGHGVGLGLSIAKGFVDAMGGRIAAASPIHGDSRTGFSGTRILISLKKSRVTHPNLL